MKNKRKWYEIKNQNGDVAEILIYDSIGVDFGGEGVSAKVFAEELNQITAPKILVRLNSPGGYVSDGVAIYNSLLRHPAQIAVDVEGMATSIASVIAMAGDTVAIYESAMFMIHDPWGYVQGNAEELRKAADMMEKTKESLITAYARQGVYGGDETQISEAMSAETWFTAQDALDAGLVDEIKTGELKLAAHFDMRKFGYANIPSNLTAEPEPEPEPTQNIKSPILIDLQKRKLEIAEAENK